MALEESIVNQHSINRISAAGARSTFGRSEAVYQTTAQPEHIQERAHRRKWRLSIARALPTLFLCHSYAQTLKKKKKKIHRSDKVRQQRCREKRQKLAKGSEPVSSSSPVSVLHQRYEGPIRFRSQSGNAFSPKTQNWGSFKRAKPDGSFPSMLLSSFILSLVAASRLQSGLGLRKFQSGPGRAHRV